jgi:outer membrane protein
MMLGGGISFSSTKYQANDDAKTSSFSFTPQFGYFVADNFAVGLGLGLSTDKQDNGVNEQKISSWSVQPFARYYMFTSSDKFAFFGQAVIGFGGGKTTNTAVADGPKTTDLGIFIQPGFAYFFNEHWALDLYFHGLSYESHDPNKDGDDDKTSTFTFDVNSLAPTFGVRYHF